MLADWENEEFKESLTKAYVDMKPTPESNSEILESLGDIYNVSPNSIRVFLTRAGVYVKAEQPTADKPAATGSKRVPKEATINKLKAIITAKGKEVDDSVVDKLTGKAALYWIELLS